MGWLAVAVRCARLSKMRDAPALTGTLTRFSRSDARRLAGFGRDLGELPGVVGAECVLEFNHELVAGAHGVSPGPCFYFEDLGVAVVLTDPLVRPDDTRDTCYAT